MTFSIGAEKMSSALVEALKSRCQDKQAIADFEQTLIKGLPNGVPKGTKLEFKTGGGKLGLSVNDKAIGSIKSKSLASGFFGVYTDSKAVCKLDLPSSDGSGSHVVKINLKEIVTPQRGATYGALIGYGLGKLLESDVDVRSLAEKGKELGKRYREKLPFNSK